MVLITLVAANAVLIMVNRSQTGGLLTRLRIRNPVALWVIAFALGLVLLGVYVPWLAAPLKLAPLSATQLTGALGLGVASAMGAWVSQYWLRYDA